MLDWTDFLDTLDVGSLVPEEYERYRPAVADGLVFFLANLPAERVFAILAEQVSLPDDADLEERLVAIVRHSPVLHKLGQVLARDRRLPERLRHLLQTLETMVPSLDLDEARAVIEQELGPLDRLGISLGDPPLAEASVAVVVPFTRPDQPERGVFKVLKPGIEARLNEDLALLGRAGVWLDERCRDYGLPEIEYEATFTQVRNLLHHEIHLDREQKHLALAHTAYAGMPNVVIPRVYSFSTPRVTAMERIDGRKVTEVDDLPAAARRDLSGLVVEALIARPIWSDAPAALFHADPHAGNLMITTDGRLAILDWSLAGFLAKAERIHLSQILLGAFTLDAGRILHALAALAEGPIDETTLRPVVEDALRRLARGMRPGLGWLIDLMDAIVTGARVRFGADLILFRKVLHTLAGVTDDISEDAMPDMALASTFLTQFSREAPVRMLALPHSRHFATHMSNADLAQLLWAPPLTAARYWSLMVRA